MNQLQTDGTSPVSAPILNPSFAYLYLHNTIVRPRSQAVLLTAVKPRQRFSFSILHSYAFISQRVWRNAPTAIRHTRSFFDDKLNQKTFIVFLNLTVQAEGGDSMKKWTKCLISFWLWIAVILVSFMMIVVSVVASSIPQVAVAIFAAVIFGLSIAVPIINPGIFAKQITSATGV